MTTICGDVNGDGVVDLFDLLELLANWGPSPRNMTPDSILSREDETTAVGITEAQWDEFLDVLQDGTAREKENWICWFERYITRCAPCKTCPSNDPFAED